MGGEREGGVRPPSPTRAALACLLACLLALLHACWSVCALLVRSLRGYVCVFECMPARLLACPPDCMVACWFGCLLVRPLSGYLHMSKQPSGARLGTTGKRSEVVFFIKHMKTMNLTREASLRCHVTWRQRCKTLHLARRPWGPGPAGHGHEA